MAKANKGQKQYETFPYLTVHAKFSNCNDVTNNSTFQQGVKSCQTNRNVYTEVAICDYAYKSFKLYWSDTKVDKCKIAYKSCEQKKSIHK